MRIQSGQLIPQELADVAYGECPGCGARMALDIETDGRGGLLEWLPACRPCRRPRTLVRRWGR